MFRPKTVGPVSAWSCTIDSDSVGTSNEALGCMSHTTEDVMLWKVFLQRDVFDALSKCQSIHSKHLWHNRAHMELLLLIFWFMKDELISGLRTLVVCVLVQSDPLLPSCFYASMYMVIGGAAAIGPTVLFRVL